MKADTRKHRGKGFAPVRRVIKNEGVPLPKNWSSFLALSENKADLARFLSEEAMKYDFGSLEVVVAGGFVDETHAESSKGRDLTHFFSNHEEADTRMVLHAVKTERESVVVSVRDTDVILLFIHHYENIKCKECWVVCGTARERKYIPIHELCKKLTPLQIANLMAFHAITGCDTTSKLASVTKTGGWKQYVQENYCKLLSQLGKTADLPPEDLLLVEQFVVQALYKVGCVPFLRHEANKKYFNFFKYWNYFYFRSDRTLQRQTQPAFKFLELSECWSFCHPPLMLLVITFFVATSR